MKIQQVLIIVLLVLGALTSTSATLNAQDVTLQTAKEENLIAVLKSDADLYAKARACEQLGIVGTAKAVPVLAALLSDEALGDYARLGLEPIGDASVDAALREAMGKLKGKLLAGVVNSIGTRRDEQAVDGLIKLAHNSAAGVMPEALAALGRIASDDAINTIQQALLTGSEPLRPIAADACLVGAKQLREQGKQTEAIALYETVRQADIPPQYRAAGAYGAIMARGDKGVPQLLELLQSDETVMVEIALRTARELPGGGVAQALSAKLDALHPDLQALVIQALVDRQDASVSQTMERLAKSDSPMVRKEALKALGTIGKASGTLVLIQAIENEQRTEESALALASLVRTGAEGTDAIIIKALPSVGMSARTSLIGVLEKRGAKTAVPALLKYAGDTNATVAEAAFLALASLASPKELPGLVALTVACQNDSIRKTAERAVIATANRIENIAQRDEAVSRALKNEKDEVAVCSLLRILGGIANEKACSTMGTMLENPSAKIRMAALRQLADWPDSSAADLLLGVVKSTRDETSRVLALRGCVRQWEQQDMRPVEEILSGYKTVIPFAQQAEEQKLILAGLGKVPSPEAIDLALSFQGSGAVREEMNLAIVQIAERNGMADPEKAKAALNKIVKKPGDNEMGGKVQAALANIEKLENFIIDWQVAGPYMEEGKTYDQLLDIAFVPEKPGVGNDEWHAMPSLTNVEWHAMPSLTNAAKPWLLDLLKEFGGEQRAAYLRTWIYSTQRQPVRLEIGSDDGIKVWLNGNPVLAKNAARAAVPASDIAEGTLHQGWNSLMVKITQNVLTWEFCLRLRAPNGSTLKGIRVDATTERAVTAEIVESPTPIDFSRIKAISLFDGKTFSGWEGNLIHFRIEDGAVVGGTMEKAIPNNEFLCTTKEYGNFELRLKCKLVEGKGNAGIQFRSRRIPNHFEVSGYQADMSAAYWGCLYDESRRNRMLATPDNKKLAEVLKPNDWNEYVIRCDGPRIQLWVNGCETVDYTEPDTTIEQTGLIGLQIHGGPASESWYKDITIKVAR